MHEFNLNIGDRITRIVIDRKLFSGLEALSGKNLLFLVDENVLHHHGHLFEGRNYITVPSGEQQKTLAFVEDVYRKMVALEMDRTSMIIGVGGGLVSDVAGFVASTFMRGIDFGFISSTLLGQVDASIGGKNGVNLDGYKNMIGIIRQPAFVWCDIDLLETLEKKELLSGFSEVIKYGAIRSRELFTYLEDHYKEILALDYEPLKKIVAESAAIKVDIVQHDVDEKGDRKLLNFGHTLGHAIERHSGMLHGEAVAIGMVMAARMSVSLGFMAEEEANRLEKLISSSGLPVSCDLSPEELYDTLLKDKKRSGDKLHFILLKKIGDAFIHTMKLDDIKSAIYDLY